uniref:Xanthine dehydrogenase n=1 Tax=Culicoides sonorensis TaxID=179676 RepID=A0A336MLN1_CULSO
MSDFKELYQNEPLVFFVNGKKIIETNPDPEQLLVSYLRENLHLTGTKVGCGEGGCGACTVMISRYDRIKDKVNHYSIIACLTPICAIHGCAITTVEGIGSIRDKLHPVQERLAKAHGLQCGFCTPGIVMSMYALLRNSPEPSMKDLEKAFQGNLCRCTGYRPIIEGYRTFTKEFKEGKFNGCPMGDKCCKVNGGNVVTNKLFDENAFEKYDSSQEIIFPPELKVSDVSDTKYILFKGARVQWYRPVTLKQLLEIKKHHPNSKIIAGNTEIGLEMKDNLKKYEIVINVDQIPELNHIDKTNDGIRVGANINLTTLDQILNEEIQNQPSEVTRIYQTIIDMLHWFSGAQIRNVATVVGNIMTGSPISDLNPIFLAIGLKLEIMSPDSTTSKYVEMNSQFFTGYRKNVIQENEIVTSFFIPKSQKNQYIKAFKQSKRRDDDIAIVNMAMNVILDPKNNDINAISVAFGGVAEKTVLPIEHNLPYERKYQFDNDFLEAAITHLSEYFNNSLKSDAPGGEIDYRKTLILSLFYQGYISILREAKGEILHQELSVTEPYNALIQKSAQLFERPNENQPKIDPIGRPEVTISAFKCTSGEAIYTDDIPSFENELHMSLLFSTKAHAKIIRIDPSEALQIPGVEAFFSANDVPEDQNKYSLVLDDERVFKDNVAECNGQVLGAIVAKSKKLAQEAIKLVKVEYEELEAIVTLEQAIERQHFYPNYPIKLQNGDIEKLETDGNYLSLEGTFRTGKQEHFYIEPHSAIVVPKDSDELEIFSSTQWVQKIQKEAARLANLSESRINVKVKRIGGGFGGKEAKGLMVALPAVFAAVKLKRPIRCVLTRDEDMISSGTRSSMLFKYKVWYDKNGKLLGLDVKLLINAGCTMDFSCAVSVLERAMMHVQNAYNIPNVRVMGWVCKTNTVSNTVYRGSGSPQATMMAEKMIREVARALNKDYIDLQTLNLYQEGNSTFYNQKILNCNVGRCLSECIEMSQLRDRQKDVETFNQNNRWKKRGITILPTMFGAGFVPIHLNQAGALVHVYTDGSVLLTHGGVEIGQGLHTKMVQIASRVLEIPMEKIHISETATDKVPNATSSSASASSDLNGPAVLEACTKIKNRLAPYKEKFPNESWESWVMKAYMDRVPLSATGFFKQSDIGYDWETNQGNAWYYFVFGAACAEVEINCLTGDHTVRRVDIVMDVGSSMNPAVDIGQIEGAFVQGYGFYTMEEMLHSPDGRQITKGPSTYKIPGFNDIPGEFYVSLLTGAPNPRAIYSSKVNILIIFIINIDFYHKFILSKAIGEPPLHLSSSVFFAIQEAVIAARKENGISEEFDFNVPATAARIRMACQDKFTKLVKTPHDSSEKQWAVHV